jgi:hypothetical protein
VTTTSLPGATRGTGYGPVGLDVAGVEPSTNGYTTTLEWLPNELPKGLKLSRAGILSGTPSTHLAPGTYEVRVTVTENVFTRSGTMKVKTPTTVGAIIFLTIS